MHIKYPLECDSSTETKLNGKIDKKQKKRLIPVYPIPSIPRRIPEDLINFPDKFSGRNSHQGNWMVIKVMERTRKDRPRLWVAVRPGSIAAVIWHQAIAAVQLLTWWSIFITLNNSSNNDVLITNQRDCPLDCGALLPCTALLREWDSETFVS